jgi:hypothetical protein
MAAILVGGLIAVFSRRCRHAVPRPCCAGVVVFDDIVIFSGYYAAVLTCGGDIDPLLGCRIGVYKLVFDHSRKQDDDSYAAWELARAGRGGSFTAQHPCKLNVNNPRTGHNVPLFCFRLARRLTDFEQQPGTTFTVPLGASAISYHEPSGLFAMTITSAFVEPKRTATLATAFRTNAMVLRFRMVRVHVAASRARL